MPTYDFRCPQGHDFERFYRKISDAPMETPCPECGQTAQRRLSAGAGLLFKGSGFYLTDYGKNAHRKPATGGGTKPGEGKSGDSGSSESKSSSGESASKPSTTESKSETKPATPAPKKSTGSGEG